MTKRAQRWTSSAAFVLGLLLAAGTVAAGKVASGDEPLRAGLTISATATGGLAVAPEGHVLVTRRLAPGGAPAQRQVSLLNQTSGPVSVLVRATGADSDLDQSLRVELRAGDARPLRASLARLRRWRPLGDSLAAQRRERVKVRVYIPRSVVDGYQARRAAVTLEFLRKEAQS